mgnify:CR=1 FL=1
MKVADFITGYRKTALHPDEVITAVIIPSTPAGVKVKAYKISKRKDLDISKQGEKIVVAYAYQREIHLVGPAFLTLKYEGRSK